MERGWVESSEGVRWRGEVSEGDYEKNKNSGGVRKYSGLRGGAQNRWIG